MDIFNDKQPRYNGTVVYSDMADNLSKIKFPVIVTESYNPNVHYSLLRDGAPPPIFSPGPNEEDVPCRAMLSGDFIIDALTTGQEISFENPDDMSILCNWIDQYIKTYNNINLEMFPDRKAFLESAKKALNMLKGNITKKDNWEQLSNPAPLTLAEIISQL